MNSLVSLWFQAKTALLRQACKEKDGLIDKLNDEIRELRHSIATSAIDDLSKIRSYGYSSPESYVKFARKSDSENATKPRISEVSCVIVFRISLDSLFTRYILTSQPFFALLPWTSDKQNRVIFYYILKTGQSKHSFSIIGWDKS